MSAVVQGAVTQAEFARIQGWTKSYVTKLKQEGRLALDDSGLVDVEASLQRIRGTTGAMGRSDASVQGAQYANAQERERFYSAELKRLELERATGKVMLADQVRACMDDAAAALRASLEAWSARLPAQIAALGADEQRIGVLLSDEVEAVLHLLADRFAALAREEGQP